MLCRNKLINKNLSLVVPRALVENGAKYSQGSLIDRGKKNKHESSYKGGVETF